MLLCSCLARQQVFKAKSQEFLDTLYSLLGYRVLFSEAGDVKLNTTYAPRGKSGVTFKFAPSASAEEGEKSNFGSMSIQGSLGKTLDELREFWVTQRQEVPCFLASVQLELYDRSTVRPSTSHFRSLFLELTIVLRCLWIAERESGRLGSTHGRGRLDLALVLVYLLATQYNDVSRCRQSVF